MSTATAPAEFVYRLAHNSFSARPGAHRSTARGAGMKFISHARLLDLPDPRRLDLRASISNIKKEWLVRTHQQNATIHVATIVDVSATMHFGGRQSKLVIASEFLQALAYSASRLGDSVSLNAFDQQYRPELSIAPRIGRGVGQQLATTINQSVPGSPTSATSRALAQCIEAISHSAALVFVISDFHYSLDNLQRTLEPLANAMIVPIVVWHPGEITPPTGRKLLSIRQIGGSGRRNVWLSSATRAKWLDNVTQRKKQLTDIFTKCDQRPFFVPGIFDAQALSRYFMEAAS